MKKHKHKHIPIAFDDRKMIIIYYCKECYEFIWTYPKKIEKGFLEIEFDEKKVKSK